MPPVLDVMTILVDLSRQRKIAKNWNKAKGGSPIRPFALRLCGCVRYLVLAPISAVAMFAANEHLLLCLAVPYAVIVTPVKFQAQDKAYRFIEVVVASQKMGVIATLVKMLVNRKTRRHIIVKVH
jgi:hypothetical protein